MAEEKSKAEEKNKAIGGLATGLPFFIVEKACEVFHSVFAEIKGVSSLGLVQLGHNADHLVSSNSKLWRHGS